MQTDYIDLYQLHWPERVTNTFGVRDYKHDPDDAWKDNFNEVFHSFEEQLNQEKSDILEYQMKKLGEPCVI